jgi:hypothetical protein
LYDRFVPGSDVMDRAHQDAVNMFIDPNDIDYSTIKQIRKNLQPQYERSEALLAGKQPPQIGADARIPPRENDRFKPIPDNFFNPELDQKAYQIDTVDFAELKRRTDSPGLNKSIDEVNDRDALEEIVEKYDPKFMENIDEIIEKHPSTKAVNEHLREVAIALEQYNEKNDNSKVREIIKKTGSLDQIDESLVDADEDPALLKAFNELGINDLDGEYEEIDDEGIDEDGEYDEDEIDEFQELMPSGKIAKDFSEMEEKIMKRKD